MSAKGLQTILKIAGAGAIVLSALLCVTSLGMWVRSYYAFDQLIWEYPTDEDLTGGSSFRCWTGLFCVQGRSFSPPQKQIGPAKWTYWTSDAKAHNDVEKRFYGDGPHAAGFGVWHRVFLWGTSWGHIRCSVLNVVMPLWFPALIFASAPTWWLCRRLARRYPKGACPSCGYDLRATPERCPECGAAGADKIA